MQGPRGSRTGALRTRTTPHAVGCAHAWFSPPLFRGWSARARGVADPPQRAVSPKPVRTSPFLPTPRTRTRVRIVGAKEGEIKGDSQALHPIIEHLFPLWGGVGHLNSHAPHARMHTSRCQNTTALAAATLRESTPPLMGIITLSSTARSVLAVRPCPSVPSTNATLREAERSTS